ncbi:MAG TPA: hypothetical protein VH374_07105 [Polyangia bacterium]|jgi:hypothetical protein|nr:hypothetical protein [Polyangia bacterium]
MNQIAKGIRAPMDSVEVRSRAGKDRVEPAYGLMGGGATRFGMGGGTGPAAGVAVAAAPWPAGARAALTSGAL